jgi:hypothetical protein
MIHRGFVSVPHMYFLQSEFANGMVWFAVGYRGMVFSPAVSHLYFLQSKFANGIVCWCSWSWGMFFSPASEENHLASC